MSSNVEGEEEPLLPPAMTRFQHTDSIYSAVVFEPCLASKKFGYFWTPGVYLIFVLLITNVILQVALTLFAGGHIVSKDYDFKASLLGGKLQRSPYVAIFENVSRTVDQASSDVGLSSVVDQASKLAGIQEDEEKGRSCCSGASCASLGWPCCDRSGASLGTDSPFRESDSPKPHAATNPLRSFERRLNESKLNESKFNASNLSGLNESTLSVPEADMAKFLAVLKPGGESKEAKEDGENPAGTQTRSICRKSSSNTWFCNPSSYSFIDRWDDLDTDKDGKWSLDEARADEANLGCHLGIPAEDVFRSNCRGVLRDVQDTLTHRRLNYSYTVPDSIEEYEAVPKEYFDWWTGFAVLCASFDIDRCSELVARGIFDFAMNSGARYTKGGIRDLDSALDYCQRMMQPGGLCEQSLPGFYTTYKSRVNEKCGPAVLTPGDRYINPSNGLDAMRATKVGYTNVDKFVEYSSRRFRFFLFMILFVWYINLFDELRDIIRFMDFVWCFPVHNAYPDGLISKLKRQGTTTSENMEDDEWDMVHAPSHSRSATRLNYGSDDELRVESISWNHWVLCSLVGILRLGLLIYLFHVGTTFILTAQGYVDLLLDSVALSFILDLPVLLYITLLSEPAKIALDGARTADYESCLPMQGFKSLFLSKSVWGIVIVIPLVYWVVNFNYRESTVPILEALRCTCLQEGPNCEVAAKFSREWWNNYWHHIHFMFSTNAGNFVRTG